MKRPPDSTVIIKFRTEPHRTLQIKTFPIGELDIVLKIFKHLKFIVISVQSQV